MKKIFSIWLILLVAFSMISTDASARRFGGGKSFGMSRPVRSFSRAESNSFFKQNPAQAASNKSRWLGPLAGLAMGGLLASLFMGNGFASGLMSWLMLAAGIMLVLHLLRRFSQPKMASSPSSGNIYNVRPDDVRSDTQGSYAFARSSGSRATIEQPAGFNEEDFLRLAKVQFIRLQAAYDQKNANDLRQFTTPDIYAEIQMQWQERGDQVNHTDVVTLDAKLLDVSSEHHGLTASVQFSGLIKENPQEPSASLKKCGIFSKLATVVFGSLLAFSK